MSYQPKITDFAILKLSHSDWVESCKHRHRQYAIKSDCTLTNYVQELITHCRTSFLLAPSHGNSNTIPRIKIKVMWCQNTLQVNTDTKLFSILCLYHTSEQNAGSQHLECLSSNTIQTELK